MFSSIRSFFATVRLKLLMWRIQREIYHRIAQQIHEGTALGYPFNSLDELAQTAHQASFDTRFRLTAIRKNAPQTGEAYGDAFLYIMHRDINRRLDMYEKHMRQCTMPKTCDPKFVATRA